MTREVWREFICAPDRAGRHLSAIGRGVVGATSDAIDLAVLQSFLEKLHDSTDDVQLLGSAVDLIAGGYCSFAKGPLHRILDALSNEMLAQEQVVGPGLRGNPRWDRTILQRMAGTLSPVHYVSRTSHRSFELPENQLLSWLVDDLRRTVAIVEQRVGSSSLHADLQALRDDCERARQHHWFGDISVPLRLTPEMIAAASRHRRPEYRTAAALARRRFEMETSDHHAWWYAILNAANREVYERSMALISAVRKGQLLPAKYEIRSPVRILEALRDRGYLRSNTEASEQYANLVVLRVGYLKPVGLGWQLHLHKTTENEAALDLAIKLLRTGTLAGMEINQEARIALTKGEEYIQSLISAAELKRRTKQVRDEQATHEFEQLLLKFD